MDKEIKKHIKEDEVISGFEHAVAWVSGHRDETRLTAGIVLLVALVAGGIGYYRMQRNEAAALDFAEAYEVMSAPVTSELAPGADKPTGRTFATAEEKYKLAAAGFEGMARRFPSLTLAKRARYLGAVARTELGDYATAEAVFKDLAARREPGELEPSLARLALADLYRRNGQVDQAIAAYEQFAGDASAALPRDYALMCLGSIQEDAKRPADARATYERLGQEFPTSVYAQEARRRADFLGTLTAA